MKPRKIVQVVAHITSDGERVYAVADDGSLWKGRVVFDSEIDPPDWGWKWAALPPLPPIEEPEGEGPTEPELPEYLLTDINEFGYGE